MGGRGSSSGIGMSRVFGKENAIALENEKSMSGFNRWKQDIFSASEVEGERGHIYLDYATPSSYEKPNRNTTIAKINLKAGIYTQMGNRTYQSHNINWDNVTEVSGQTYNIKGILKDKGFVWDGSTKSYRRKK